MVYRLKHHSINHYPPEAVGRGWIVVYRMVFTYKPLHTRQRLFYKVYSFTFLVFSKIRSRVVVYRSANLNRRYIENGCSDGSEINFLPQRVLVLPLLGGVI